MTKTAAIPLSARRSAHFSPPSLVATPKECALHIRVPTPSERDLIGARMFELGLRGISQESLRATQINELFKIDWREALHLVPRDLVDAFDALPSDESGTGIDAEALADWNDSVADALAQKFDSFWISQQAEENITQAWLEQEVERIRDEAAGAPPRKPAEPPKSFITPRNRAEVRLLTDFQTDHCDAYRRLLSRQIEFNQTNNVLLFRTHVMAIEAIQPGEWPPYVQPVFDKEGVMTLESCDELREFIGEAAYNETWQFIDGFYGLAETERKNSDSPPAKQSDPIGSPVPNDASATSGGEWTDSNIEPTPSAESEMTIEPSFASLCDSGAPTEAIPSGQTEAAG